jgi:hypothetical protein
MAPSLVEQPAATTSNGTDANALSVKPQLTLAGKVIAGEWEIQLHQAPSSELTMY